MTVDDAIRCMDRLCKPGYATSAEGLCDLGALHTFLDRDIRNLIGVVRTFVEDASWITTDSDAYGYAKDLYRSRLKAEDALASVGAQIGGPVA